MSLTTIVVPTVGRDSLHTLLAALRGDAADPGPPIIVVDDRPRAGEDLRPAADDVTVVRSGGRGPAAARNLGWRLARTPWVSFLDDDVVPDADWCKLLHDDLATADGDVVAVQGRVRVPLPADRRPTDWERSTAGLEDADWITADMSYRRDVLGLVGGFDERFRRAYREDSDLALRAARHGRLVRGSRTVLHPARRADQEDPWVSVRQQAGNADDVLMAAVHGPSWREAAGASRGRLPLHVLTVAAAATALLAAVSRRRRLATSAAVLWAASYAEFAWHRIAPGPRTADEVGRMAVTSAAIPFAAVRHRVRGVREHARARAWRGIPDLVLFDRDGTLVHDVPYNADPGLVRPVAGAANALERLRRHGVRVGVVSNQSGIGRGLLGEDEVDAVDERVRRLLGPFDVWRRCPHTGDDACACRKPAPGMVLDACAELGVDPARCVVVGDIAADVQAARAAGGSGILVPNAQTSPEDLALDLPATASVGEAVDAVLAGCW